MAGVVVTGGGMIGLSAAMLLARDGHSVTVLERDAAPPPSPAEAWETWERRGVNQFRLLHFLLPRWRELVEAELADVANALADAGAARFNPLAALPVAATGGPREGDEAWTALTARRPVAEAVVAAVAERTPGVTVRRGVAVAGLQTGASAADGIPHVAGVVTDGGEQIPADVVVDATGRRSPLPEWLRGIGARPPDEQEEDLGFVYYGRHFRSGDGSLPEVRAGQLEAFDSVSVLALPADNGTWGIGFVASSRDARVRALKDVDAWTRALRSYPLFEQWVDGEPLGDVAVMARIPDRHRRFVVDGSPVVTGILAVGDSWACTNPSLGRGISIGFAHAVALRDLLHADADDPYELARAWDDVTERTVTPWYDATVAFDRHRLAEIDAAIAGEAYESGDPQWEITRALQCGARRDPDLLRSYLRLAGLQCTADELLGEPGLLDRVIEVGGDWRDEPPRGPSRAELLATIAG